MDGIGTGAASLQILATIRGVYRRLNDAYRAPEHFIELTRDTRTQISIIEKLASQAAANHLLSREASRALADLQEVLRLLDCQKIYSIDDTPVSGARKVLWKQRFRLSLQYLCRQGKVGRLQEAINNRVPWLLLDTIVNTTPTPPPFQSVPAISFSTTPTTPVKSRCEFSLHTQIYTSSFIDRNSELTALTNIIASCKGQPRAALIGLPGSGKTRLALEYARTIQQNVPTTRVYLVHASSEDRLTSDLKEIGMMPSTEEPMISQQSVDRNHSVMPTSSTPTIFIVDEYNNMNALFGPKRIIDWFQGDASHVIIFLTWDISLVVNIVEKECILRLRGISLENYSNTLRRDGFQVTSEIIKALYSTIGSSPLSLRVAWNYMRDNGIQIDEYLNLFSQVEERVNLLRYKIFDPLSGQTQSILDSVSQLSHALEKICPLAKDILQIACCLTNLEIPHSLLRLWCLDSCDTDLCNGIGHLKRLSIFSYNDRTKAYLVEPMIVPAIQGHLHATKELEGALLLASKGILDCIPNRRASINTLQPAPCSLQHAKAVLGLYRQQRHMKFSILSARIGFTLVRVLQGLGDYEQAQDLSNSTVKLTKENFGHENELHLTVRSDLATSLDLEGRFSEAEEEARIVLQHRRTLLGPTNATTLSSMRDLALTIEHQGRYEEAEAIYRKLLDLLAVTEASNSEAILAAQQRLAVTLQGQGELEEAYRLFQQVLDRRITAKGSNLPIYISMSNVGCSLWSQNRVEEAWEIHNDVFSRCEREFGRGHPQTIRSMCWLALILQSMGNEYWCAAEAYWRESLALYKVCLGQQHPDTLRTERNLATVLHERGRLGEALRICQYLLRLTRKHREIGPTHPAFLAIKDHKKELVEEIEKEKIEEKSEKRETQQAESYLARKYGWFRQQWAVCRRSAIMCFAIFEDVFGLLVFCWGLCLAGDYLT